MRAGIDVLEDFPGTGTGVKRHEWYQIFAGLFYGCEGMTVGGRRRLRVAPHLGYGQQGVPGVIPANALLIAELEIVSEGFSE